MRQVRACVSPRRWPLEAAARLCPLPAGKGLSDACWVPKPTDVPSVTLVPSLRGCIHPSSHGLYTGLYPGLLQGHLAPAGPAPMPPVQRSLANLDFFSHACISESPQQMVPASSSHRIFPVLLSPIAQVIEGRAHVLSYAQVWGWGGEEAQEGLNFCYIH